jgi:hypothetical protein
MTRNHSAGHFLWLALASCLLVGLSMLRPPTAAESHTFPECHFPGWSPSGYNLKDHTIFTYQNRYYLISNLSGRPYWEKRFIYAVSDDLCTWEELGYLLTERRPGDWDEMAIWAPHVIEHEGTFYMFYTGVTYAFAQSIFLATSSDPADPETWTEQGVIFQPDHPGSLWAGFNAWSDCRDPFVWFDDGQFQLLYTGRDVAGGIIGLASAPEPVGPWQDQGALITLPDMIPESPVLLQHEHGFYLVSNETGGSGPAYRYLEQLGEPASAPFPLFPGWAHEFWQGLDGRLYSSYLTYYEITITPVSWDQTAVPPRLFLSPTIRHAYLPLLSHHWQPPAPVDVANLKEE